MIKEYVPLKELLKLIEESKSGSDVDWLQLILGINALIVKVEVLKDSEAGK